MSAEESPVDVDTLDMLRELADEDNPDFFEDIIQSLSWGRRQPHGEPPAGARSADVDLMARSAHTLKSSSANLGANDLAALCANLERRARSEESLPDAQDVVAEIHRSLQLVLEFLANQI